MKRTRITVLGQEFMLNHARDEYRFLAYTVASHSELYDSRWTKVTLRAASTARKQCTILIRFARRQGEVTATGYGRNYEQAFINAAAMIPNLRDESAWLRGDK